MMAKAIHGADSWSRLGDIAGRATGGCPREDELSESSQLVFHAECRCGWLCDAYTAAEAIAQAESHVAGDCKCGKPTVEITFDVTGNFLMTVE